MAVVTNAFGVALPEHGSAKLLAWVGDGTPWQLGAAFVATKTADTRRDLIARFLDADRESARSYHDAVTEPDERVDVKDVPRQIGWFRHEGMVKGDFNPADMSDRRYIIPRAMRQRHMDRPVWAQYDGANRGGD